MVFGGLTISSISFDFEIFPDGTCPSLGSCGGSGHPNLPDLTVISNGSHQVAEYFGVVPGQAGSYNIAINHLKLDPVPEPATITLLASGLIGLGAALRRRARALRALGSVR